MSLVINTNTSSLNAQRNLGSSQAMVNTAMQRLSSGLRINSAKDDAAGLAIADRMTAQIRGMNQAARNLNDSISMLQTAEGALQEITNLIQRGRELSVQAGNTASLSASDKTSLQSEIEQIKEEVDRIGKTTTFNGTSLFQHGEGGTIGGDEEKRIAIENMKSSWLANSEKLVEEHYKLTAEDVPFDFAFTDDEDDTTVASITSYYGGDGYLQRATLTINQAHLDPDDPESLATYDRTIAHEMTHAVMAANMDLSKQPGWFVEGTAEFMEGGDPRLATAISNSSIGAVVNSIEAGADFAMDTSQKYAGAYVATRFLHESIKDAGGNGIEDVMVYLRDAGPDATLNDALADIASNHTGFAYSDEAAFMADFKAEGVTFFNNNIDLTNADVGAIGGADADGEAVRTIYTVVPDTSQYTDDPLTGFIETWPSDDELGTVALATTDFQFQAGANAGQWIEFSMKGADSRILNLADVDISDNPGLAIGRFDEALEYVDTLRGDMGALMNRFESTIANLMNVSENLSAARSRILDADIAMETSNMTKGNILQQAGVSILAQANQAPQLALSLLG